MSEDESNLWTIAQRGFDPATAKAYEGLFSLGSGYLHIRGSLEEHMAGQPQNVEYTRRPANVTSEKFRETLTQWGTYVPGVFGHHPLLNNQMINLPWPLELAPVIDGERLDVGRSDIKEWSRELSLRDAVLRRVVVWRTRSGATATVHFERFISASRPHLVVQRIEVRVDRPCDLSVAAGIDADVRTNGHAHFTRFDAGTSPAGERLCEVTTDAGDRVSMRSRAWIQGHSGGALDARLEPGRALVVHKRTWVHTSRDLRDGDSTFEQACAADFSTLLGEHAAEWLRRWEASDVRIEGDPASQLAIRTALFHLLRSHVPGDPRVAIDAKGYAGEAYWGRYFWDTEMYLFPFFAYTQPEKARTLADFRIATLDGARRNAARYGYPGARYAWESDHRGEECCPNWQYADHEIHVTAGVAYGLAHYAAVTGDAAYLHGDAARVLVETARYWMERITFEDRRRFSGPRLLGVMGPDEYKPITSDNAYTNRMVAHALRLAAEVGMHAGAASAEIDAWRATAAALPVRFDAAGTLVLQCDGFDRFADPEFDRFWIDRDRTFAAQVSQERLYRSKCLKQADVLMLMAMLPGEFTDEQLRKAWDYYLPYTTHDSSLSAGIHCLLACRLGLDDQAWAFWQKGSRQDLPESDGGDGGAAEGVHIAGAGAAWQMAVMGFAGVRSAMHAGELTLAPRLPKSWNVLAFPLVWKGQPVRIEIERGRTRVHNLSERSLLVVVGSVRRTIAPEAEECFA